jgi:hypothetical protein
MFQLYNSVSPAFQGIFNYDLNLDHWGLQQNPGETAESAIQRIVTTPFLSQPSNALHDLAVMSLSSPLMNHVQFLPDTTYFSFAAKFNPDFGAGIGLNLIQLVTGHIKNAALSFTYRIISSFSGSQVENKVEWKVSDGAVPLTSQITDIKGGYNNFAIPNFESVTPIKIPTSSFPVKGKFNYIGFWDGQDHLGIVGLYDTLGGLRDTLYVNVAYLLDFIS